MTLQPSGIWCLLNLTTTADVCQWWDWWNCYCSEHCGNMQPWQYWGRRAQRAPQDCHGSCITNHKNHEKSQKNQKKIAKITKITQKSPKIRKISKKSQKISKKFWMIWDNEPWCPRVTIASLYIKREGYCHVWFKWLISSHGVLPMLCRLRQAEIHVMCFPRLIWVSELIIWWGRKWHLHNAQQPSYWSGRLLHHHMEYPWESVCKYFRHFR